MIDVEVMPRVHDAQKVALFERKCSMIGFGCQESLHIVITFPDMQLLMHKMKGIPWGKNYVLFCVVCK
jgi:hypothetical protein